eukprot:CAMPEP_0184501334 /NCGR_PEP_ID=MMETSP0113_2-20130426/47408_1 /TAXON_ID=91329 /ORGANISM="Norrisiella sphaerica, Strain BC52" /LENGTH=146 /DNA_ID=CAMNT_0026890061 /DNA_START=148 /DNA_END=585 /DNA_ORIENTATION=-
MRKTGDRDDAVHTDIAESGKERRDINGTQGGDASVNVRPQTTVGLTNKLEGDRNDDKHGLGKRNEGGDTDFRHLGEEPAGFLSRYFYTWMTPLMVFGESKEIHMEHLSNISDEFKTSRLLREFDAAQAHINAKSAASSKDEEPGNR